MPTHGTATETVRGTFVEFSAAVLRALPRDLTPEVEIRWTRNGESLSRILRNALMPKDFELTLDFDATDPIVMLTSDGINPNGWEFKGTKPKGIQTRRFKLVQIGYHPNLDAVRMALASHGDVPEGQWREAFKVAYPTPNGKGLIGIADPSWVAPGGNRYFPCLSDDGARSVSDFFWAGNSHSDEWQWLVACK